MNACAITAFRAVLSAGPTVSLAFTDVLWLLFLREEYELDFTRILVLAVAAVQATMFSGALVTLVNSRFPLARGVRRHLLAVAAGTASLFGCMLFLSAGLPVLFRLDGSRLLCADSPLCADFRTRIPGLSPQAGQLFFGRRDAPSAMGGRVVSDDGLDRTDGRGMAGVGVRDALPVCFYGVYMVFYTFFGMKYINYPAEFGRIVPGDRRRCAGALWPPGRDIRTALDEWIAAKKEYVRPGAFARVAGPRRSGATAVTCRGMSTRAGA
ncbi:MAG: hypothetical protein ACLUYV_04805 [Alistipes shahii]